ncbi:MAG: sulfate adenylyltransferase [Candidatus Kerfeldbacteria bacterium]|nr:sulfate adenylyltransferase [Candidatus Kerfeldbacteria bacterium]
MEHVLIPPHGNVLVNRVLSPEHAKVAKEKAASLVQITIDEEQIKDIKNIARGVLSPLTGLMNEADFVRVVNEMRLANGILWSMPMVLDVSEEEAGRMKTGDEVALIDEQKNVIAILHVGDIYSYDAMHVTRQVYGTNDQAHPGVDRWMKMKPLLVGGLIDLVDNSKEPYYEFNLDPLETRFLFKTRGWKTVVGFQTRNAPHRAHEYLQRIGLELCDGLFINPIIGMKKVGDFKDEMIMKTYDYMAKQVYAKDRVVCSILPSRMNYAGPRDAIYHAIIRKNFGCTHFIVGRDHAGVGDYYGTYAAQEIFENIAAEDIGITILKLENSFMCKKCETVSTSKTCGHQDSDRVPPSGTKIRNLLTEKKPVPWEIMRPEVVEILLSVDNPFVE